MGEIILLKENWTDKTRSIYNGNGGGLAMQCLLTGPLVQFSTGKDPKHVQVMEMETIVL